MKLNQTSVLCLASFVLSLSASAAFTRLATETYPGGGGVATNAVAGITTNGVPVALDAAKIAHLIIPEGGGPTGGVTKAYVDAADLATLFASTNYTDSATNALDLAHLAAIAATNTALRSVIAASAASSTNYTDTATNATVAYADATFLGKNDKAVGAIQLEDTDTSKWISADCESNWLIHDANHTTASPIAAMSDLNAYLPLAGGTMTGPIQATSITFENGPSEGSIDIFSMGLRMSCFKTCFVNDNNEISEVIPDNSKVLTAKKAETDYPAITNAYAYTDAATNALDTALRAEIDNEEDERKTADSKLLTKESTSYPATRNIKWSGYNLVLNGPMLFETWSKIKAGTASSNTELPEYLADGAWNTAADPFAKKSDIPDSTNYYPFALGNMVSNTVSQWEGYWNGSNVYWSVTNYLEAGNAKIMRLYEIQTNGVHREIWNDSDKYDIFFTNTLDAVASTNTFTREWVGTFVTNSLDAKADRAWGKYTSSGYDVPDTNMVWHTAPTTVFAGGFEFQKVAVAGGEIGVLVSQGAVPYAAGAEGKFIIGDGFGTNYFGYVKKDDYIIATRVDGITVDQATKMVTLTYDLVFSGEYPIVYYSPTVIPVTAQTWIQLNKIDGTLTPGAPWPVTFSTGAGYIKAHISFASATAEMPPDGFFTSSTAVIGGGTFKTNMKADFLDAGIMCTNTDTKVMGVIRPTFDGTTVHWNWSKQ